MTIINHSFLYDPNDNQVNAYIPIIRRIQQANHSPKNNQNTTLIQHENNRNNSDDQHDYILVDHDLQETAKQIEQILHYYRQDLKYESNTYFDCNQQLLNRLIDFIRPAYSSNEKKMNDLNTLLQEIGVLHEKRHVEQKERYEQLLTEVCHLKKLIITTSNEDDSRNNTMTKLYRMSEIIFFVELIIFIDCKLRFDGEL